MKDPMILPLSSIITSDHNERHAYDRIIDEISRPLMQSLSGLYEFAPNPTPYPDGIRSNFVFHGNDIARPTWRFLDLTRYVTYLSHVLDRTIREVMREESRYMRSHVQARIAIKDIVEMPDIQIDRIIRSAEINEGKLSNVLIKKIPIIGELGVWDAILKAIDVAFRDESEGSTVNEAD